MGLFSPSLLPNPFREGSASHTIAERLKRKPQWALHELVAGLDVANPYCLLSNHVKPVYKRRRQNLVMRRGVVTLQ